LRTDVEVDEVQTIFESFLLQHLQGQQKLR
jgi:hypothetical protein